MQPRFFILFLILASLISCGSEKPSGDLAECRGYTTIQEEGAARNDVNLTGNRAGQYLELTEGTEISSFMIKGTATGLTGMRVLLYWGPLNSILPGDTPLKEFTFTKSITTSGKEEIWLDLPTPYVLPPLDKTAYSVPVFYFLLFEPIGGTMGVSLEQVGANTRFRKGLHLGSSIQWQLSSADLGFTVGIRSPNNCQVQ